MYSAAAVISPKNMVLCIRVTRKILFIKLSHIDPGIGKIKFSGVCGQVVY